MKKSILIFNILLNLGLFFPVDLYAHKEEKVLEKISIELVKDVGLTEAEQKSIVWMVKEMLRDGTDESDIKKTLTEMKGKGIRGEELVDRLDIMWDLIRNGRIWEAGDIVSDVVLEYGASGGIMGFSFSMIVFISGEVQPLSGKRREFPYPSGKLTAEELEQLKVWVNTYGRVVIKKHMVGFDTFSSFLRLYGRGKAQPDEKDKQAMLIWGGAIFERFIKSNNKYLD